MNTKKLSACLILCAASVGAFAATGGDCTSSRPIPCLSAAARPATVFGVDEWWTQKVYAEDGAAGDVFGFAAALQGDVAMIGAAQGAAAPGGTDNGRYGAVYVYDRAAFLWTASATLHADDGAANDQFGYAIALDGDTALVSAAFADVAGRINQGAVYVFTHGAGGWTQTQKLVASDGAAGDQFGWSVAIHGDRAIVGARGAAVATIAAQGAAYVFARKNGTWTPEAKLTDSGGAAGDQFGFAVGIHGAAALVAAPNADGAQGAAVFFDASGGTWTQGSRIAADDGAPNENFGYSLAFDGATALVSAPFAAVGSNLFQGSVYAFVQNGGAWTQVQKLTTDDGQAFDVLGISVAIDGDAALFTAPFVNASQGAAYRYTRSGGTWSQAEKIVAYDAVAGDGAAFGYVGALSNGSFVIGQALANNGNAYQGAAYFYEPAPVDTIFSSDFESTTP